MLRNKALSLLRLQSRKFSNETVKNPSNLISKFGILIGMISLPIASFYIYDRLAAIPPELQNLHFPLPARFYIRLALFPTNSIQETAKYLDLALKNVLSAGIGSASPESTGLVIFLSKLYLDAKESSIPDLEAAHYALTFKPHVGEALKEEIARVDFSFKVADRLCSFYSSTGHENLEKVHFYSKKSLELMEAVSSLRDHPLKQKFNNYAVYHK